MIDTLMNMKHETVVTLMIIADMLSAGLIIHLIVKYYKKNKSDKVIHG